ncbi:hypothetical protein OV450_8532, partial [Actinobacteria bacterium OV450]
MDTGSTGDAGDAGVWADLFDRETDGRLARFVRPAGTERPVWAVYDGTNYLGTVNAQPAGHPPLWQSQTTGESYLRLEDAVRALRRPSSWPREREHASRWARRLLRNRSLTALGVETTSLHNASAVQITAMAPDGTVLFSAYLSPGTGTGPAAALDAATPPHPATAPPPSQHP